MQQIFTTELQTVRHVASQHRDHFTQFNGAELLCSGAAKCPTWWL